MQLLEIALRRHLLLHSDGVTSRTTVPLFSGRGLLSPTVDVTNVLRSESSECARSVSVKYWVLFMELHHDTFH